MVTCFFFPGGEVDVESFTIGEGCSNCPALRPTCSAFFKGLCGIDAKDEISGGNIMLIKKFSLLIVIWNSLNILIFLP